MSGDGVEVDCFGPFPEVTLIVHEVLFGKVSTAKLDLFAYDVKHPELFPSGVRHPVIAYLTNWGGLEFFQSLAKTRSGEWAVPVGAPIDLPSLPCSGEELLTPRELAFMAPTPKRALDEYDDQDRAILEASARVEIRNGFVHFRDGILLSEIFQAREEMPIKDGQANYYFTPCLAK